MQQPKPDDIVHQFAIYGEYLGSNSFGNGHINDTFQSRWNQAGVVLRYTHQRINQNVFAHPDKVMENILRVTRHITQQNRAAGLTDYSRRCLTVVPARDGRPFVRDEQGGWWRTYMFIEGSHTQNIISSPMEARFLGACIGHFQKQLSDFPPPRLYDTIPKFHNMGYRYMQFYQALEENRYKRADEVKAEIDFFEKNEERGRILIDAMRDGRLPERICHNDTKINNILIDDATLSALCVIDLDTVMPGSSLFDVGDLIRTVCTRTAEDDKDLSSVDFDTDLFKFLLEGYFSEAMKFLKPEEIIFITEAGRNITQIMALRFLTDYLDGDKYYHTCHLGQNLDRCRNQIALIKSMDCKWDALINIEEKCLSAYL